MQKLINQLLPISAQPQVLYKVKIFVVSKVIDHRL